MMDRFFFSAAILVVIFIVGSNQRSIEPTWLQSIANRNSIQKTAPGLPQQSSGNDSSPSLTGKEFREIVNQANQSIPPFQKAPLNRPPPPKTFPFGPHLLSSETARKIARAGQLFLEIARRLRERLLGMTTG